MPDVFDAISFAARAHRHQVRRDGQTPYVAHVVRVMLVVRHVFGIDDPKMLCAAVLHDTIEDTTTDYDDISERFGRDVANWVAALTKDMRMPEVEREAAYLEHLLAADWQVCVCKLADIYDNLNDSAALSPAARMRTVRRCTSYLSALSTTLPPQATEAFRLVEARLLEVERSITLP